MLYARVAYVCKFCFLKSQIQVITIVFLYGKVCLPNKNVFTLFYNN